MFVCVELIAHVEMFRFGYHYPYVINVFVHALYLYCVHVIAGTIHIFQMDWKRVRRPVLQSALRAKTFASGEKLERPSWQPRRWSS